MLSPFLPFSHMHTCGHEQAAQDKMYFEDICPGSAREGLSLPFESWILITFWLGVEPHPQSWGGHGEPPFVQAFKLWKIR